MLAGDQIVFATPQSVYAWPATGGRWRRIADTPDLGSAANSPTEGGGFIRVESAQPGRIVIARGGNSALSPDFGSGHQVVVGPPAGPYIDPAGCGESSGMPAVLDGDLLAYHAEPAPADDCTSAADVTARAIVVRDLGNQNRIRRVVPLPDRIRIISQLELAGNYLAYAGGRGHAPERQSLFLIDMRTGDELFRLPPSRNRFWALDSDGTIVTGRGRFLRRTQCFFRVRHLRERTPESPTGRRLPGVACGVGMIDLRDGVLRYGTPRPDGRQDVVDHKLADGSRRTLATIGGFLVDADENRLLVEDDTCLRSDLRVVAIVPYNVQLPAGPRRCPVHVRAPRRVRGDRGDRYRVHVRCPRGCRLDVEARTYRGEWTYGSDGRYRFRRRGVIRLTIPLRPRPSTTRIRIIVSNPAAPATVIRRRVQLLPR